jgi:putative addiction module killer protein
VLIIRRGGRGCQEVALGQSVVVIYRLLPAVIEVRRYVTGAGRTVFSEWFAGLADRHAKARIADRLDRLEQGSFGDCKPLSGGLYELRIDWGPGYQIYYAMIGRTCLLLLCGGDKRKQSADIQRAREYLRDYRERTRIQ